MIVNYEKTALFDNVEMNSDRFGLKEHILGSVVPLAKVKDRCGGASGSGWVQPWQEYVEAHE